MTTSSHEKIYTAYPARGNRSRSSTIADGTSGMRTAWALVAALARQCRVSQHHQSTLTWGRRPSIARGSTLRICPAASRTAKPTAQKPKIVKKKLQHPLLRYSPEEGPHRPHCPRRRPFLLPLPPRLTLSSLHTDNPSYPPTAWLTPPSSCRRWLRC